MAIRFGEDRAVDFASGNLMTFAKSFSAMNGQPLDNREVWYDKTALEKAAAGSTMYVGQKVCYIDVTNQKVYQYSVQLDGTLKEIGVAPVSDGATIAVNPHTGVVSLYGVTGLDSSKTYVPSIINGVLTWAEPDNSTAEGQQASITALETRAKNAEDAIDALEATVGTAESGLVKNVADNKVAIETEVTVRKAAVKSVSDVAAENASAITSIDARVTTVEGKFDSYYTKDEANIKIAEEIGKQAHFSAKVVSGTAEMLDPTVLYLVKDESVSGEDKYNQYIVIEGEPTLIGDTTTNLEGYATSADVESKIVAAIAASEEKTNKAIDDVDARIGQTVEAHTTFETTVAETYATKEALENATDHIAALDARVGTNETNIGNVTNRVVSAESAITALQNADTTIQGRLDALEGVSAEKNVIAAVSSEFTLTDDTRTLGISAIAQDKVIGLADALNIKVSRQVSNVQQEDGTTKEVEWTLLSPENQEKLKALVIGESGVEISGTVNAENVEGLDSYITGKRNSLDGLYPEADAVKLLTVEAGAQSNIIEKIKVASTELSVTDKVVEVPFAALATAGVVRSSTAENAISVAADGTMSVYSLNVNKLVQTTGDELIINGGTAST